MPKAMVQQAVDEFRKNTSGQVVLVLQGGGALGAYQVGVYEALHEAGVEPDWIIGTLVNDAGVAQRLVEIAGGVLFAQQPPRNVIYTLTG